MEPWSRWALCVVALTLVVVGGGCPDPCLLAGGCNANSDCRGDSVCRVARSFETGCPVLAGTCLADDDTLRAPLCGSVDDCDDDECCDPQTNRCIAARLYMGPFCDALTCGDCDETQMRARCTTDDDCDPDEACDLGTVLDESLCAQRCEENRDCGDDERCSLGLCTVRIGTPCDLEAGLDGTPIERRCYGLSCTNVDANGDTVDPYCTGNCILEEDLCPAPGYACADDQCRPR
ncbi:MAG: hypothetical protein IT383_11310 [Deltaproteobacteria bacterium]|nr:hypothetical protein [Deltaproteobacteria bacterium]